MSVSGILVLGRPSTGKSTSLRNLDPATTVVFTPNTKPLPFPGGAVKYKEQENRITTSSLVNLKLGLAQVIEKKPNTKVVVIEDFSHFLSARTMSDGFMNADKWGRWEVYAADIHAIIKEITEKLSGLEAVIMIHHTQIDKAGIEGFLSSGNLLDEKIKPVSFFTYVLHSVVLEKDEGAREYAFQTNFTNNKEAKTPMGLFKELYIPNDMNDVIKSIKSYENEEEPTKPVEAV